MDDRQERAGLMHALSVPVFSRYLGRLAHLVDVADEHAQRQRMEPSALLEARLTPDMLPFGAQVDIAAQFALRACAPLADSAVPPFGHFSDSLPALRARIDRASTFLAALTPQQMDGSEQRPITEMAGLATIALPGREFLLHYALPNFFFHAGMAYAILRHAGVVLGKSDFDGFHVYAGPGA